MSQPRIVVTKVGDGSVGSHNFTVEAPYPGYRVVFAHIAGEGAPVTRMSHKQLYLLNKLDANNQPVSPFIDKVQFNYTLDDTLDVFAQVIFEKVDDNVPDIMVNQ